MRKAMTIAVLSIVSFTTLGMTQPASATPPCTDCVVDGIVAMAGWHDWDSFAFEGTIVGTMVLPTAQGAVKAVGSIAGSASLQQIGAGYVGSGSMSIVMTFPCVGTCTHYDAHAAEFGFTIAGDGLTWTIAGNALSRPVTGAFQLAVPKVDRDELVIVGRTYVGALAGAIKS